MIIEAAVLASVVVLHLTQGASLLLAPAPVLTTGLAFLAYISPQLGGIVLIVVATLASLGIGRRWLVLWAMPQQIVLVFSCAAAMGAVWAGSYPDGTLRHWTFILSDQLPMILLVLLHTAALLSPSPAPPARADSLGRP